MAILKFLKEVVKVCSGFFDEVSEDSLDNIVTVVLERLLELRAINDDEAFSLLSWLVVNIVNDILETINGVFVSLNWVSSVVLT